MSTAILAQPLSASTPAALPAVNPDDAAAVVKFYCAQEGITPAEYAADLEGYTGPHAEKVAAVRAEAIRQSSALRTLTPAEQRAILTPRAVSHEEWQRRGALEFATWQHSRFVRSESRKRKTARNCKRCLKLGRACYQHGGRVSA